MSGVHKIVIKEKTYHLVEQSAAKQLELYEMLSARLLANCVTSYSDEVNIDIMHGFLLSCKKVDGLSIQDVADIVLYKTVLKGSEEPVNIEDFQGDIHSYVSLVAEGCMANLSSFFFFIRDQVTQTKELVKKMQEEQKNRL